VRVLEEFALHLPTSRQVCRGALPLVPVHAELSAELLAERLGTLLRKLAGRLERGVP
jgi:hypothetical protein